MLIMGQGRDDYIVVMFHNTGLGGRHKMGGHKLFGGGLRSPSNFLVISVSTLPNMVNPRKNFLHCYV